MRKVALSMVLLAPCVLADGRVSVEPHNLLRLAGNAEILVLERLEVADQASLLIPATVRELHVEELRLGENAYIGVAPSEQAFLLDVRQGDIGPGSRIAARGVSGNMQRYAGAGRTLTLRLQRVTVADLTLDVRGGQGSPGYAGLGGAYGQPGGCLWGRASRGHDGQDGGDGRNGGPGGQVRVEIPLNFPAESLHADVDGGAGGPAGEGGSGGKGGASKGCWLYRTDAGRDGRTGNPGKPGLPGIPGAVDVVRF
ncbi:collagen-like protein [Pseudomonas sp. RIT-PI-AD]|uniref:collagen-like protein n=1 Tax=Pseudomonas sp. RIT-PI-AD TaxID=3035294 RepID=UPI0021DA8F1B|nr:collagen-like protein [Pseudomonas sp. RIT-PI-AD]